MEQIQTEQHIGRECKNGRGKDGVRKEKKLEHYESENDRISEGMSERACHCMCVRVFVSVCVCVCVCIIVCE